MIIFVGVNNNQTYNNMALLRSITKSWLTINPETGSGNATVTFTGTAYSGRTQRSQGATLAGTGVDNIALTVNQTGMPEYVDVEATKAVTKTGGDVTINGKSNSTKLTVTLGTGGLAISVPENITAASKVTANGAVIEGDPGATAEYDFSFVVTVPSNVTVDELTKQLIVTTAGGQTDTCVLTQTAGDPVLEIDKTTITLDYTGAAVTANIISNLNWTIS